MTLPRIPYKTFQVEIPAAEEDAFREHIEQFHVGSTPAQRAAEARFFDQERALDALIELLDLARSNEPYSHLLCLFLVGLSRGESEKRFDLTGFRDLPEDVFEKCVVLLRLTTFAPVRIEAYFDGGDKIFDALKSKTVSLR